MEDWSRVERVERVEGEIGGVEEPGGEDSNALSVVPVGVLLLPTPRVGAHLVYAALGLPAKLLRGERRIGPALGDVAGTARADLVGNRALRRLLERLDDLKYGISVASAEVVDLEPELRVLLKLLDRLEVADSEVHDVDVVADSRAVWRRIVVAEDIELGAAADCDLRDIGQKVVGNSRGP